MRLKIGWIEIEFPSHCPIDNRFHILQFVFGGHVFDDRHICLGQTLGLLVRIRCIFMSFRIIALHLRMNAKIELRSILRKLKKLTFFDIISWFMARSSSHSEFEFDISVVNPELSLKFG